MVNFYHTTFFIKYNLTGHTKQQKGTEKDEKQNEMRLE